ncbi:hypothetical protein V5O48_013156 [Marasmius crinis-equi]|uniref:Uncharacterized protein n=1 Tax=Marasmius crinis-equi TaxID=585013 RepID=A0ABR3F1A0_9AGAR
MPHLPDCFGHTCLESLACKQFSIKDPLANVDAPWFKYSRSFEAVALLLSTKVKPWLERVMRDAVQCQTSPEVVHEARIVCEDDVVELYRVATEETCGCPHLLYMVDKDLAACVGLGVHSYKETLKDLTIDTLAGKRKRALSLDDEGRDNKRV